MLFGKFLERRDSLGGNGLYPFALEVMTVEDDYFGYVLAQIHYAIYDKEGKLQNVSRDKRHGYSEEPKDRHFPLYSRCRVTARAEDADNKDV